MEYTESIVIIAGFAVIFVPLLIWILNQLIDIKGTLSNSSENMGRLDERVKNIEGRIEAWQVETRGWATELYKLRKPSKNSSNPISPEEKERLLNRLRDGTLSTPEAEEIRAILEKEKKEAEDTGDILGALIIGLLLGAIAYLLYKMLQGK